MKKILFVSLFGGFLLLVALWWKGGRPSTVVPSSAGGASIPAATVAASPPAATAPAIAPAATVAPSPAAGDEVACAHLAELCTTSDNKVDADECVKQMGDARKMAGAPGVERSEVCLADARTCIAASGCMSGGVGMGAAGEYLKGLGAALSR